MSSVKLQVQKFTSKIEKTLKQAVSKRQTSALAEEAIKIIVRRTRLGYGVKRNYSERYKLPGLSTAYIKRRRNYSGLAGTTTPKKSNLTFTGQMLESVSIIRADDKGMIVIGPKGRRRDRLTNVEVAEFNEQRGRIFNRLSRLEFQQLLRIYRKNFGDLLQKMQLIK